MSEKLVGSCIFGQSGGPTAVINASAYGVIRAALDAEEITKVYGAAHGIKGVLNDRLYDISLDAKPGMKVKSGRQCGIIKFGSQMEIYLPLDAKIKVSLNESTRSAETIIAEL